MSTKKKNREELQFLRDEALEAYLNREDFQYDLNGDALYRQYKDRYVELGKNAMQDTMGQAAALTGGYGSTYAQSVGQQAYQSYLQQLGDVVPELYKLAYDRYRDKGDDLYRTYQSWSQLEQEAAKREQEAAQREQEAAQRQQSQEASTGNSQYDSGYYGWLAIYQGKGERSHYNIPNLVIKYDNGNVTTGDILTMQRVLGQPETGMWVLADRKSAGGLSADKAWEAYQKGQLQIYKSYGLGDLGVSAGNVKVMERVLGLKEDGVWSAADAAAAGGRSKVKAWEAYQRGLLQLRR